MTSENQEGKNMKPQGISSFESEDDFSQERQEDNFCYFDFRRTISEGVLLADSSTPRKQLLKTVKEFYEMSIEDCKMSDPDSLTKLEKNKISRQNRRESPAQIKELSEKSIRSCKMSMETFVRKSDGHLPEDVAKSARKSRLPMPLTEASISCHNALNNLDFESEAISDIQQILLTNLSATSSVDELLKPKKKTKSKSQVRTSLTSFTEARKENILPEFHPKKSLPSSRDSALSALPNGKLPIRTTKTEIIWGCIKPGEKNSQEFAIRNMSSSLLEIKCTVTHPSFRINEKGSDLKNVCLTTFVLPPYADGTFTVTFAPTLYLGASVGKLIFTSTDPTHKQTGKQLIRLYGYGGYANVIIHEIIKRKGDYVLPLGNIIDKKQELRKIFVIKNYGSLAAFAYCNFILDEMCPFSSIDTFPAAVVLLPGEQREVVVTFHLYKKDYTDIKLQINSAFINVGTLQVIHGTEVDRARLRRLCLKAEERNHKVDSDVLFLAAQIPWQVIPYDVKHFKESLSSIDEVLGLLSSQEITVILELHADHIRLSCEMKGQGFTALACEDWMN